MPEVPQPAPDRIVPVAGRPLVVGVGPRRATLLAHTAAVWAHALGSEIYFAYADPSRMVEEEFPDGRIRHVGVDPDSDDQGWQRTEQEIIDWLTGLNLPVAWEFRYLAGRADRALTHLARYTDACAIVVGARNPHSPRWGQGHSLGQNLARHQHRPVLAIPLNVVDWKQR
ncbi:MAG TPA: universal stress protein UspA [Propionibacteriaceae bacterium]|nr:universal stress protein UspA [Propionibacteriaceae bacterium]